MNVIPERINFVSRGIAVLGGWRKLHFADWAICAFTQYHQGKEIKEGVMRGACSMYGGGEKYTQVFG